MKIRARKPPQRNLAGEPLAPRKGPNETAIAMAACGNARYYVMTRKSSARRPLGMIVLDGTLDRWTLVGIAIVTGSGLYLFYRKHVRQKYPGADLTA